MLNIRSVYLKKLGIDTYKEAVIYLRKDCHICRSEGFETQARIQVTHQGRSIIATLNTIDSDLLQDSEASLSHHAWERLGVQAGDQVWLSHPKPLQSLSYIRRKVYGHELNAREMDIIIKDLVAGYLSDVHVATFLTANAAGRLNKNEILDLTKSMFQTGDCLTWPTHFVVDKHCVGGLPGNRTSLIVVPIVAAFGLTMPKTSSRAITSPAGTADTMEVLAPVTLDVKKMQQVVERENGCIVWGGAVSLSPADDLLIRVERVIELDSEGQLVASILSKKISAGATHVVVDIPIGPTAKVRTQETAVRLKHLLEVIGRALNVEIQVVFTEGASPVGRGIGPALEARDVLSVLRNEKDAPADLRERALTLAGHVLSFSPQVAEGTGKQLATTLLTSGQAWEKFQAICLAQGGLFEPPIAPHIHEVCTAQAGKIMAVDNRRLARIAKLAGAPQAKVAGVRWLVELGQSVEQGQPLFEVHAESSGALKYALHYLKHEKNIIQIED